ncbi:hypothetical protein HMPREF9120_01989, partial [Neisseria sp. oral taxon 020 str. F0370]
AGSSPVRRAKHSFFLSSFYISFLDLFCGRVSRPFFCLPSARLPRSGAARPSETPFSDGLNLAPHAFGL